MDKQELEERMLTTLKKMNDIAEVISKMKYLMLPVSDYDSIHSKLEEMKYKEFVYLREILKQLSP